MSMDVDFKKHRKTSTFGESMLQLKKETKDWLKCLATNISNLVALDILL